MPTKVVRTTPRPAVLRSHEPSRGDASAGTVSIEATASDAGVRPGQPDVSVDGLSRAGSASGLSWNTNAIGMSGQTYIVRAHATDNAGNTADSTITVTGRQHAARGAGRRPPVQSPTTGSPTSSGRPFRADLSRGAHELDRARAAELHHAAAPGWTRSGHAPSWDVYYVVTAADLVGNSAASAPATVNVINISKTAPRSISANSPTNTVPHVTWQPPVSFPSGLEDLSRRCAADHPGRCVGEQLRRHGPGGAGPAHLRGAGHERHPTGDISSAVSVTFDTMAPALSSASATANPTARSLELAGRDRSDARVGAREIPRPARRGSSPPSDPNAGTTVCTLTPPANGCTDATRRTTRPTATGSSRSMRLETSPGVAQARAPSTRRLPTP